MPFLKPCSVAFLFKASNNFDIFGKLETRATKRCNWCTDYFDFAINSYAMFVRKTRKGRKILPSFSNLFPTQTVFCLQPFSLSETFIAWLDEKQSSTSASLQPEFVYDVINKLSRLNSLAEGRQKCLTVFRRAKQ